MMNIKSFQYSYNSFGLNISCVLDFSHGTLEVDDVVLSMEFLTDH